jgi:hypothetical protein
VIIIIAENVEGRRSKTAIAKQLHRSDKGRDLLVISSGTVQAVNKMAHVEWAGR